MKKLKKYMLDGRTWFIAIFIKRTLSNYNYLNFDFMCLSKYILKDLIDRKESKHGWWILVRLYK